MKPLPQVESRSSETAISFIISLPTMQFILKKNSGGNRIKDTRYHTVHQNDELVHDFGEQIN